jgi:hypothetical protein
MFQTSYTEAKRFIAENDYEDAVDRLDRARPECGRDLWLWTDLMAAVLFAQHNYSRCHWVLSEYDSRCPGDRRIEFAMALLREAYL